MNMLIFCPEYSTPNSDYFMQNSSYSISEFLFVTPLFSFLHNFKCKCIKQ